MSKKLFVVPTIAETDMENVVFVGDVHARPDLVAAAIKEAAGRRVIFVGDIFDGEGGAQGAKDCVDLIRASGAEMILGNHELYPLFFGKSQEELAEAWGLHYDLTDADQARIWDEWCKLRALLTADDVAWLRGRPLWIKGEDADWVAVHAKVPHGRMPYKFVYGKPTMAQIELVDGTDPDNFWAEHYNGEHGLAIVGHTRRSKIPQGQCSWDCVRLLDWDAKKGGPGCLYFYKEDNMREIATSANKATASEKIMENKTKTTAPVPATPVKEPAMKNIRYVSLVLEIGMMEVTVKAVAKIIHAQYANVNAHIVGIWGNRPPKEKKKMKMNIRHLSLVLAIASALDLPDTTVYTPWSAGTRANTCVALACATGLTAEAKARRKTKAEKKAAKAAVVKAAQAAEHRAMHVRGLAIASWLQNRKVCTAPAASRQVRKARSLRRKAQAIANRAVAVADYVNPNEGNIPSWVTNPIGMILPKHPASKGKASVRRMARYQASPWGRAKIEEQAKREEARNARRAIRQARLAEDRAIRLSREEARAKKAAQKAATKLAPKKGNAKRAYMAAISAAPAIETTRTIRCVAKVNGLIVAKETLTAKEAVAYLERQGYKPVAAPVPTAAATAKTAAKTAPVAPRVVAEATPTHALKIASAAKADAVIAQFNGGKVKLFTVTALQAMVTDGVYDLAGNLNPDQKAALWAERQARQARVRAEKAEKNQGAKAMFLKANPLYAEFKANQAKAAAKKAAVKAAEKAAAEKSGAAQRATAMKAAIAAFARTEKAAKAKAKETRMGYKVATVTQEKTK